MLFSMRVSPRARVTFVSAKVTKAICPVVAPHQRAMRVGGVPCASRPRRGLTDRTSCPAANARLPGAPLAGLTRLGLRCSVRLKGRTPNLKNQEQKPGGKKPKASRFGFIVKAIDVTRPFWPAEHRRAGRRRPAWIYHAGRAREARVFRSTRTYCRKTPSPTEERRAPHHPSEVRLGGGAGRQGRVALVTLSQTFPGLRPGGRTEVRPNSLPANLSPKRQFCREQNWTRFSAPGGPKPGMVSVKVTRPRFGNRINTIPSPPAIPTQNLYPLCNATMPPLKLK